MPKIIRKVSIVILTVLLTVGCDSKNEQVNAPVDLGYIPGDVNNNSIAFEIADAVLFSAYFVYGAGVFTVNVEAQVSATDANRDGLTLSIADLVYMVRTLYGDPTWNGTAPVTVLYYHHSDHVISIMDDIYIGAAFVVVNGMENPVLLAGNMEMEYAYDAAANKTRILVWSIYGRSFTGDFLRISNDLVSLELATSNSRPVVLEEFIPDFFYLYLVGPNPFDDSTVIHFEFARSAEGDLFITNESGRTVYYELNQFYNAGAYTFVWDVTDYAARQLPNGVYYFSLIVEDQEKRLELILQR